MLNQNPSTFTFNGHSSDEFGIRIQRKPDLNRSGRKFATDSVAGRNGNIYQMQDAWEEVVVSYAIYAGGRENGDAIPAFTDIMEWLNSADDYAVLTDSYDPEHYRLAVFVDAVDVESQWYTIGAATIRFRCKPERFIVQKPITVNDGGTITNKTNHVAKPIITLTGAGQHSMIFVEKTALDEQIFLEQVFGDIKTKLLGNYFWIDYLKRTNTTYSDPITIMASSDSSATIDSTTSATGTIVFTPFFNNYGLGMLVEVSPKTTYTLSFSASATINTRVGFVSGNGGYISKAFNFGNKSGATAYTFTTDYDTEAILLAFYKTDNSTRTISGLMLAMGDSAQTFREYVSSQTDTFTIGGVTISMRTQGFATAEIDCVKENFLIDGEEKNTSISVVDSDGNPSEAFITIPKGSSEVSFTNGITAASIDPRYWEL